MIYQNTFILVADDCPAQTGESIDTAAGKAPTIHGIQFSMLSKFPYKYSQEDISFNVYADRNGLKRTDRKARDKFFEKGHPCMRASALTKRYGWGVHFDDRGTAALYGVESKEYKQYATNKRAGVTVIKAMRNKRK